MPDEEKIQRGQKRQLVIEKRRKWNKRIEVIKWGKKD
jgi:hypothetical protein